MSGAKRHARYLLDEILRRADKDLSPTERHACHVLGSYMNAHGYARPGLDTVARDMGLSPRQAARAVDGACGPHGPFVAGTVPVSSRKPWESFAAGGRAGRGRFAAYMLKPLCLTPMSPKDESQGSSDSGFGGHAEPLCMTSAAVLDDIEEPFGCHGKGFWMTSTIDSKASMADSGPKNSREQQYEQQEEQQEEQHTEGVSNAAPDLHPERFAWNNGEALQTSSEPRPHDNGALMDVQESRPLPEVPASVVRRVLAILEDDDRQHGVPTASAVENMIRARVEPEHWSKVPDVLAETLAEMSDETVPRSFDNFLCRWLERLEAYGVMVARLFA